MPRFCSFSPLKWHWMHPILKASRKILTSKYYDKFAFIQIRDSMGAHLIFFIIFTLFSCIILANQSLPWYSLWSGFQCDTNMAAVFSCMRPIAFHSGFRIFVLIRHLYLIIYLFVPTFIDNIWVYAIHIVLYSELVNFSVFDLNIPLGKSSEL